MFDEIKNVLGAYGIPSFWILVLVGFGNFFAAWLAQIIFPMHLKKSTLKWEKERWATEQLIESLSRVEFFGKHLIRSEVDEKASLSRLGFNETEEEIVKIITDLHRDGYRIRPYLSRHNQTVFDDYLKQSSAAFDASRANHGEWMPDDYEAEADHGLSFVNEQSLIAGKLIGKMDIS
ncbi:MAG: hypothetical protein HYS20_00390 [Rhodocyclales bacterium]|nr:hypothetical protein [Rhodocyclales bacterium]